MNFSRSEPSLVLQIMRFWSTVRYLRPAQITARARLRAAHLVRRIVPRLAAALYQRRVLAAGLVHDSLGIAKFIAASGASAIPPWPNRSAVAVLQGKFNYLNDARALGRPVDWAAPGASDLWRHHLHYFAELPQLAVLLSPADVHELMREWIDANPFDGPAPAAWHPYVVSQRLVNWMVALEVLEGRGVPPPPDLMGSLAFQAVFLDWNVEDDVGGNHLIANLKALVFAGCYWRGDTADRWRTHALARLERELSRQVLADGGHYERSPMYHCEVAGDLLEVVAIAGIREHKAAGVLLAVAQRMVDFLEIICHPDGGISLFNDSAFGKTWRPEELRAFATALRHGISGEGLHPRHRLLLGAAPTFGESHDWTPPSDETSGFVRLDSSDGRMTLIFDAGPVCPDDLPAHGHCDLLSFEASVNGVRFVVDAGVADYQQDRWREYWRSTRAHNTVTVDGLEQSDCWGSFRVGHRARPVDVRQLSGPRWRGVSAAHTGFMRFRSSVRHRRAVLVVDEQCWLVLDELSGAGSHGWRSFVHLHPECAMEERTTSACHVARGDAALRIVSLEDAPAQLLRGSENPLQGWYGPQFGIRQPCWTMIFQGHGVLPLRFGYLIAPAACGVIEAAWCDDSRAAVRVVMDGRVIIVPFGGDQGAAV